MSEWQVTFCQPQHKVQLVRYVDASNRDSAIVAARENLHCPWVWSLSSVDRVPATVASHSTTG